jgi:hypothetical protein
MEPPRPGYRDFPDEIFQIITLFQTCRKTEARRCVVRSQVRDAKKEWE